MWFWVLPSEVLQNNLGWGLGCVVIVVWIPTLLGNFTFFSLVNLTQAIFLDCKQWFLELVEKDCSVTKRVMNEIPTKAHTRWLNLEVKWPFVMAHLYVASKLEIHTLCQVLVLSGEWNRHVCLPLLVMWFSGRDI